MWNPMHNNDKPRKPKNWRGAVDTGYVTNGLVKVPRSAYTHPPEPVPSSATDEEHDAILKASGLWGLMAGMYPKGISASN
jgi:hypothetical protein